MIPIHRDERLNRVLVTSLGFLVLSLIALGARWGFPVQDDSAIFQLIPGGVRAFVDFESGRPLYGFILGQTARLFGRREFLYIAVGVLAWLVWAAEAAALWKTLYPEFRALWPVVALASVSPVLAHVQFSTVTIVYPCLLPVELVLAAVIVSMSRRDRFATAAGLLLPAAASALSEYGMATSLAGSAFLLARNKKWNAGTLMMGTLFGYAVHFAMGNVATRKVTNPSLELSHWLQRPLAPFPRIAVAVWDCVVGSWGRVAGGIRLDWDSKSTLAVGGLAVIAALSVGFLIRGSRLPEGGVSTTGGVGRLAALVAAVAAGLVPSIVIKGWPPSTLYDTRVLLPVFPFACCATMSLVVAIVRSSYLPPVLSVLSFLAVEGLATGALEEHRLSAELSRFGEELRPFVDQRTYGWTVFVVDGLPERFDFWGRITRGWTATQAARVSIQRPQDASKFFGERAECRPLSSLEFPSRLPTNERGVAHLLFWRYGISERPEPYYLGCGKP